MAEFGLLLIRLEHRWNCLFWEDLIGGDRRARMKVSHSIFHRGTMRGDLINSVFSSRQGVYGNYVFILAGAADKGKTNLIAQCIL